MNDDHTTQPISCPTCGALRGRDCTCDDHVLNTLTPRPMRVYHSTFWGRLTAWLGIGVIAAAMLAGCSTGKAAGNVYHRATGCAKGAHSVPDPVNAHFSTCVPDAVTLADAVKAAIGASGMACAGIDNRPNVAAWGRPHHRIVTSTYTDEGDYLRYAHPAPTGRTLEALKRAEDSLGIGKAGHKVVIACA
jgi:hypothetical protein